MNAYDMLQDIRANIDEATADHWTDAELLQKLNAAQRKIAMKVSMAPGNWLVKSKNLTPSSGVITLPSDCAKPLYIEEQSSGNPLFFRTTVQDRYHGRESETWANVSDYYSERPAAYTLRATIEINSEGYSTPVTLWYQIRVPDLHTGSSQGGGSAYIQLASDAYPQDDYYNNAQIEIVTSGSEAIDTITDYTKTNRQATVTGTYSASLDYGTISMLPEECHPLIVLDATCLALSKSSGKVDPGIKAEFHEERKQHYKIFNDWISTRIPGAARHTRMTQRD